MLLIYWLIKIIIGQYQTYVYNKNEERGFCTAEQKYLTDEEKLRNLRADLVAIQIERTIRSSKQGWNVGDFRLYISKYDFNEKEKIIDFISKVDINKSFEENFGLIAVATVKEYDQRKYCLKEKRQCSNFNEESNNIKSLWDSDNTININYLKNLPNNSSILTYSSTIYPLSTLKKISKNKYTIESYSINPLCCDNKKIYETIDRKSISIVYNFNKMLDGQAIYSQEEPKLQLDQIDGEKIDNIYIEDLYENLALNQPKQIQHYGLLTSVGGLRRNMYPLVREILVTACGTISEEEQVFNSSQTQSGDKPSLRKRYKL